jgi:hypothetical protein
MVILDGVIPVNDNATGIVIACKQSVDAGEYNHQATKESFQLFHFSLSKTLVFLCFIMFLTIKCVSMLLSSG